jgi:nucleotide-binding universal stress UspA family protein
MDRTIICAIDETTSDAVARTAAALTSALGGRLLLAHVAPDPALFDSKTQRERDRNQASRAGMALLQRMASSLPADVDWDSRIEFGDAADELRAVAEEIEASLLVVGSRGRGLLASTLLGSVSEALGRDAPCPVAVVPRHAAGDAQSTGAIVVGIGASGHVALTTEVAGALGGRIVLVPGPGGAPPAAHVLESVAAHEGAGLVLIGTDGATDAHPAAAAG